MSEPTKVPSVESREVWVMLCDLVLANVRRRETAEAVGMSFAKVRAIRRIARRPMAMGELSRELDVDPPNTTTLVDELEALGLAKRKPHPTDRRAKLVTATRKGEVLARKADEILSTPPAPVADLDAADVKDLKRILMKVTRATT